jgi:hypothetical protein
MIPNDPDPAGGSFGWNIGRKNILDYRSYIILTSAWASIISAGKKGTISASNSYPPLPT